MGTHVVPALERRLVLGGPRRAVAVRRHHLLRRSRQFSETRHASHCRLLGLWRSHILYSCAACTLLVIGWLRAFRCCALLLLHPDRRPPGCSVVLQQRHNGTVATEVLSDPLFARLCTATPVRDARGGCFEVDGSTVCLPTFLVIGFTKAGTTAFFQYAAQHPLVHASRVKEPGFLGATAEAADRDAARAERAAKAAKAGAPAAVSEPAAAAEARRRKSLQWYTRLFGSCARCERGEATPSYAWRDYSPAAAAQARPLLLCTRSARALQRSRHAHGTLTTMLTGRPCVACTRHAAARLLRRTRLCLRVRVRGWHAR